MATGAAARSVEQREEALKQANQVRFARAKLKREIASRRRNPIRVLQDPPAYAMGMKVREFLGAVPGLGENKIASLLRRCGIFPLKTLGELTERQRLIIANGIKEKIWTRPCQTR